MIKSDLLLNKPLALFMLALSITIIFSFMPQQADARNGHRGGKAHSSVNRNSNRNTNVNRHVNRNTNVNRNVNRNTNVNVNVNRHGHRHYPVGAAIVAGAVIGSIIYSLPPSGSTTVIRHGISYSQCGSVWYQPQYSGNNVTYIVVNQP